MCVHALDNGPAPISCISDINGPLSGEKNGRLLELLVFHTSIIITYIHTYIHSRFNPEGVAEASRIFFPGAHVLPKLLSYDEYCRRDRW
jgi:hypothetical protein